MILLAAIAVLALTRAEIIERMKTPIVTRADGLIKVYADCPEDMCREFQVPIAGFAANTAQTLYHGLGMKPRSFTKPGIVIHIGDVRTNVSEVVARVVTNDSRVVTRLYVRSPGYVNLDFFKLQLVKAFYRCVQGEEITDEEAVENYRKADPSLRTQDEKSELVSWLAGRPGDDEEYITRMRKVFEPGQASTIELLIFASRLFLYPDAFDRPFMGEAHSLSFRQAVKGAKRDPRVRVAAFVKSADMVIFTGGRGDAVKEMGAAYSKFLVELSKDELSEKELLELLEEADTKLNVAFEEARKREEGGK